MNQHKRIDSKSGIFIANDFGLKEKQEFYLHTIGEEGSLERIDRYKRNVHKHTDYEAYDLEETLRLIMINMVSSFYNVEQISPKIFTLKSNRDFHVDSFKQEIRKAHVMIKAPLMMFAYDTPAKRGDKSYGVMRVEPVHSFDEASGGFRTRAFSPNRGLHDKNYKVDKVSDYQIVGLKESWLCYIVTPEEGGVRVTTEVCKPPRRAIPWDSSRRAEFRKLEKEHMKETAVSQGNSIKVHKPAKADQKPLKPAGSDGSNPLKTSETQIPVQVGSLITVKLDSGHELITRVEEIRLNNG